MMELGVLLILTRSRVLSGPMHAIVARMLEADAWSFVQSTLLTACGLQLPASRTVPSDDGTDLWCGDCAALLPPIGDGWIGDSGAVHFAWRNTP